MAKEKKTKSADNDSAESHDLKRRDFLVRGGAILLGVSAVSSVAAGLRFASPDFSSGAPAKFPLGRVSDFKMNTLSWLRDRDMFVLHDKIGFGAFSAKCTHLGCIVQRTSDGFQCPCHGARFGPKGEVLSGPAREDLPWFRLWADSEGVIWVDSSVPVEAGTASISELKQQASKQEDS